jgi:hypothetical protein
VVLLQEHIDALDKVLSARLKDLQEQSAHNTATIDEHLDSLEDAGQAQLLALQKQVDGLGKYLKDSFILLGRSLDSLDKAQQARLDDERKLTTQRLEALEKFCQAGFQDLQARQKVSSANVGVRLDHLDDVQRDRLREALAAERGWSARQFEALQRQVALGIENTQKDASALSERIHQLEQAPLKRFWRWLTRKGRKNGSTL